MKRSKTRDRLFPINSTKMKSPTASVILLAAALNVLALTPLSADSKYELPIMFSVRTLTATVEGGESIQRGTTRSYVSSTMRRKVRKELSPDVWVYPGYKANHDLANAQRCETLVITFADDKVIDLKLVNGPAVAAIAAYLDHSSPVKNITSAE